MGSFSSPALASFRIGRLISITVIEASGKDCLSETKIGFSQMLSAQMSGSFVDLSPVIGIEFRVCLKLDNYEKRAFHPQAISYIYP